MDDDDASADRLLALYARCASAAWRSSSSGLRSSTPTCSAPAAGRSSARSSRSSACSTRCSRRACLKRAWDRQGPRPSSEALLEGRSTSSAEDGGWAIRLDGRPVRTPARAPLVVPTEALAEAIAEEWRASTARRRSARDAADRPRQCGDRPGRARAQRRSPPGLRATPRPTSPATAPKDRARWSSGRRRVGCAAGLGAAALRRRFRDHLRARCTSRSRRRRSSGWPCGRGARRVPARRTVAAGDDRRLAGRGAGGAREGDHARGGVGRGQHRRALAARAMGRGCRGRRRRWRTAGATSSPRRGSSSCSTLVLRADEVADEGRRGRSAATRFSRSAATIARTCARQASMSRLTSTYSYSAQWLISSAARCMRSAITSSRIGAAAAQPLLELGHRRRQEEDRDQILAQVAGCELLGALPVDVEEDVAALAQRLPSPAPWAFRSDSRRRAPIRRTRRRRSSGRTRHRRRNDNRRRRSRRAASAASSPRPTWSRRLSASSSIREIVDLPAPDGEERTIRRPRRWRVGWSAGVHGRSCFGRAVAVKRRNAAVHKKSLEMVRRNAILCSAAYSEEMSDGRRNQGSKPQAAAEAPAKVAEAVADTVETVVKESAKVAKRDACRRPLAG